MEHLIDHKQIKPSTNYLLIKPDEEMEKYHLNGKETSILVGRSFMKYMDPEDSIDFSEKESVDTHAQHWPISGTVIAKSRNNFFGREIQKKMSIHEDSITPEDIQSANKMKDCSSKISERQNVDIGDRVMFDYAINMKCYDGGLYFHTDIGVLFLVRYDDIFGKINDSGITPLNGNIFFEWEKQEKIGSLYVPQTEIYDAKGLQKGSVTHIGEDPRYYLEGLRLIDMPTEIFVDDKIIFSPIDCTLIESQSHLTIFGGKEIYTISRHRVLAKEVPVQNN